MDHRPLVAAGLLACSFSANAFFANLSSPAGLQQGAQLMYKALATEGWAAGKVATVTAANVGGRTVAVPIAMRLAAAAPRFAARAIFVNPLLAVGVLALAAWVQSGGFQWDADKNAWVKADPSAKPSDGKEYSLSPSGPWYANQDAACRAGDSPGPSVKVTFFLFDTVCRYHQVYVNNGQSLADLTRGLYNRPGSCPIGWYSTPAGCVQNPPRVVVPEQEFEDQLAPKTLPDLPPGILPIPLPVEIPVINPSPGSNPWPQPLIVPLGDPAKVPQSNPETWAQPAIRIKPANNPQAPLQTDNQPISIPVPNPSTPGAPAPVRSPYTPVTPDPSLPVNPADPVDPSKDAPPKTPDLCETNPDIVACQKLGGVDAVPVPDRQVALVINKEDGFGPANGTCPSPKTFVIMGKQMAFEYTLLCDFASAIRPLIVGFAYLSATLAFLGLSRKEA